MNFRVSVIIPAYNAEKFIEKAIHSALQQDEVSEVIVVNDGSTDKTGDIIKKIQNQNAMVKIYDHEHNANQGRSASRNLGIENATGNYIAFLDADDFYLPNRFENDKKLFQLHSTIDGVYNAIGAHFYRESTTKEFEKLKLFTINKKIDPENLFEALISGKYGYFSIDGLTLKKSVFQTIGKFNENLLVSEDTDLFWKMALKCRLIAGILDKPVAKRGVHDKNVFNRTELYDIYDLKMYESLYVWSSKKHIDINTIERFLERIWIIQFRKKKKLYLYIIYWIQLNLKSPRLLLSHLGIKYFPLIRLRKNLFPYLYN